MMLPWGWVQPPSSHAYQEKVDLVEVDMMLRYLALMLKKESGMSEGVNVCLIAPKGVNAVP